MLRTFLASAAVLACTGCGATSTVDRSADAADDATTSPTWQKKWRNPQQRPAGAQAPTITGTGYTFRVPKGWGLPPQPIPGFDPDSVAFNLRDQDSFADNINVLLSPVGPLTPSQVETDGRKELAAFGAKDVHVGSRTTIAGSKSAHLSATMSLNGTPYRVEQYAPTHDGQTYVVTFSFSAGGSIIARAALIDSILATWTWTS
jgi:hypothetical protein